MALRGLWSFGLVAVCCLQSIAAQQTSLPPSPFVFQHRVDECHTMVKSNVFAIRMLHHPVMDWSWKVVHTEGGLQQLNSPPTDEGVQVLDFDFENPVLENGPTAPVAQEVFFRATASGKVKFHFQPNNTDANTSPEKSLAIRIPVVKERTTKEGKTCVFPFLWPDGSLQNNCIGYPPKDAKNLKYLPTWCLTDKETGKLRECNEPCENADPFATHHTSASSSSYTWSYRPPTAYRLSGYYSR